MSPSRDFNRRTPPGFTRCHCEYHHSALLVKFYRGCRRFSLLLQSDYDQASFAVHCGLIKADGDWDGSPSSLGEEWVNCNLSDIEYCPMEYFDIAEEDEREVRDRGTGPVKQSDVCAGRGVKALQADDPGLHVK